MPSLTSTVQLSAAVHRRNDALATCPQALASEGILAARLLIVLYHGLSGLLRISMNDSVRFFERTLPLINPGIRRSDGLPCSHVFFAYPIPLFHGSPPRASWMRIDDLRSVKSMTQSAAGFARRCPWTTYPRDLYITVVFFLWQ